MINKTKISPRVITYETDNSSSAPRTGVNGRTGSGGNTGGSSSSGGGSNGSNGSNNTPITESSCTATPFSNGYDSLTLYCYNNIIINNKYRHSAYVACDYVN